MKHFGFAVRLVPKADQSALQGKRAKLLRQKYVHYEPYTQLPSGPGLTKMSLSTEQRDSDGPRIAMTEFDPYYKWLAIPHEEQPPNCYRLLGVPLFTDDRDVIENAAHQRMVHLRSFQLGERSALSQRVLNEVAAAKVCLLTPDKKATYDVELRSQFAIQQSPSQTTAPPAPYSVAQPPVPGTPQMLVNASATGSSPATGPRKRRTLEKPRIDFVKIFSGGVAGLVLGYLLLCWVAPQADFLGLMSGGKGELVALDEHDTSRQGLLDQRTETNNQILHLDEPASLPLDQPKAETHNADDRPQIQTPAVVPEQPSPSPPVADAPKQPNTPEESKEDRLVWLATERDTALKNADVSAAMKAVERIAALDGGDLLEMQFAVVMQVNDKAESPADFKLVVETLLPLLEQAIGEKRKDVAELHVRETLLAARKSGDSYLVRQATLCVIKVQQMESL